jgi:hypothetical protein
MGFIANVLRAPVFRIAGRFWFGGWGGWWRVALGCALKVEGGRRPGGSKVPSQLKRQTHHVLAGNQAAAQLCPGCWIWAVQWYRSRRWIIIAHRALCWLQYHKAVTLRSA